MQVSKMQIMWQDFKVRPDRWFFCAFLAIFPFTIRKIVKLYPVDGQFNEYSAIYLYLSDILLFGVFLSWALTILYNNKLNLSRLLHLSTLKKLFHVEQLYFIIPLLLVFWSFLSIIWAENRNLAFFRSLKIAEFYGLYLYIIFNVSHLSRSTKLFHVEQFNSFWGETFFKRISQIIIASGVFQSCIAMWQFIVQKSIGLRFLGESIISPDIAGVAKLEILGGKIMRSYGLFPHPNILGGFLLISILLTLYYQKMFHSEKNVSRGTFLGREKGFSWKIFLHKAFPGFWPFFTFIQILALLTSFSKSAIIGLLISFCYIFIKNVPRGTFMNRYEDISVCLNKMQDAQVGVWRKCFIWETRNFFSFGKYINVPRETFICYKRYLEQLSPKLWLLSIILLVLAFIGLQNKNQLFFKTLEERLIYINVSPVVVATQSLAGTRETEKALKIFVLGVGSGNFVAVMDTNVPRGTILAPWQYQPVHNVFLLIWSELGLIGVVVFSWWLWKLIQACTPRCSMWNTFDVFENCNENVPCGTFSEQILNKNAYIRHNAKIVRILKGALLGLIFIMLFDHYLWDIQQGQALFWMIAGLITGLTFIRPKWPGKNKEQFI